ncbi:MAG: MBL fold metallo-hydrolase [Firmicutes bacterium]|nr:MBL fold metallo-hydrolase [Bacillota bacterium]
MIFKRKLIPFALAVAFALCGCQSASTRGQPIESAEIPEVTGEFSVSLLKVGKADAIILQTENHCAVIDCGEKSDGDEVAEHLADIGVESVDYLFITHFDKDHVGGAAEVISTVGAERIIIPDYSASSDEYTAFIEAAEESGVTPERLSEYMTFVMDDVLFEVYPPQRQSYAEEDNDFSLAVSVKHGSNSFLFAGDAESVRLSEILEQTGGAEYDFLKVPHHGNFNSMTSQFIAAVNPTFAVITCNKKNPADEETIAALENAGSEIYYTMNGDVLVTSDGESITVTQ